MIIAVCRCLAAGEGPRKKPGGEKMKTYLVTGGMGFIGSHFILQLLGGKNRVINFDKLTYAGNPRNLAGAEKNPNYSFVQADICDEDAVAGVFVRDEIDYVVNFAAESHVDRSIADPMIFIKTNVLGTANLLEQARRAWRLPSGGYRAGVRFLQVSTDEVYGSLGETGFFTEETPLEPHSPYAASKASADLLTGAYGTTYGLPVNITRCSNNFGPRQYPEKLIPLMLRAALAQQPLPVYGDGEQTRDWLYVGDHCRALALVLERGAAGEVYNIGGHCEYTNLAIIRFILNYLNRNINSDINERLIMHVEDRLGHDRRYAIDAAKLNHLGWSPQTDFQQGLAETIGWYLQNRWALENGEMPF